LVCVRGRTITLVALGALLVAGCGGADRSGQAGEGAEAGPAAAYAPADSLVYLHADKRSDGWKQLAAFRDAVDETPPVGDGAEWLAWTFAGSGLEPQPEIRAAAVGESAFIILSNKRPTDASHAAPPLFLAYDTVTDRAAVERGLAKDWTRAGDDGGFALYSTENGAFAMALSDTVSLSASHMVDLRAAIARGASGGPSLADDPDFRAALARDHDADAAIRGYSRGDLASAVRFRASDDDGETDTYLARATNALGLAKTAFDVGATAHGIWVHAHPAATASGYHAAEPFEPTLLQRAPSGTLAYLDLSDVGDQLPQLARLLDQDGEMAGTGLTSASAPAWFADRIGLTADQVTPFLHGEQGWWWGRHSTGAAFRSADPDAAYAAAQQVATKLAGEDDWGSHGPRASRDGDVVTVDEAIVHEDQPPPANTDAMLADDSGFAALLRDAALPDEVSVLLYGDHRTPPSERSGSGEDKSTLDVLGRALLWTTPADGGYDLGFYAELIRAP
jgi:hypothetical protein